ncbi:MAG: DUF4349 domain-containing protein [Anaerolineales bacterium]
MKRIGFIVLGVAVFAIVFAVAFVTISAPMVGRVFSTINAPLGSSDSYGYAAGAPAPAIEVLASPAPAMRSYGSGGGDRSLVANGNPVDQQRMVIKNADLTIVVKDPAAKMQAISKMTTTMGGFVVSSTMDETVAPDDTKVPEGSMVVRIPAGRLDEALKDIKADAVDVQNETQTGQDVTKEYTDQQSQLKNLEATEQQLTLIMQKADKTEDVLAVFNQLTDIRGQIEVAKGQIQYYQQSADLSAVSVRLIAEKTIQPIKIAGWEPQGQVRDAVQALIDFFQNFVTFLIWLVILYIPAAAIIVVLLVLLWRLGKWLWPRVFPKKPAAIG